MDFDKAKITKEWRVGLYLLDALVAMIITAWVQPDKFTAIWWVLLITACACVIMAIITAVSMTLESEKDQ